jgi:hypothetical protein
MVRTLQGYHHNLIIAVLSSQVSSQHSSQILSQLYKQLKHLISHLKTLFNGGSKTEIVKKISQETITGLVTLNNFPKQ